MEALYCVRRNHSVTRVGGISVTCENYLVKLLIKVYLRVRMKRQSVIRVAVECILPVCLMMTWKKTKNLIGARRGSSRECRSF